MVALKEDIYHLLIIKSKIVNNVKKKKKLGHAVYLESLLVFETLPMPSVNSRTPADCLQPLPALKLSLSPHKQRIRNINFFITFV